MKKAFIYLDPPYLNSFKLKFIQIYLIFKDSKCKILFGINNNAITKYLYKDYFKQDYLKNYDSTKIRKIMMLKPFQEIKKVFY